MTEDEARQKWCPIFIAGWYANPGGQDTDRTDVENTCMASDCMMWRWTDEPSEWAGIKGTGFCGLAVWERP